MGKKFSVKTKILLVSILPAILVGVCLLVLGIQFMKSGMEEEILKGLLSSAYVYKDVGVNVVDREAGDNELESNFKKDTGYDFTWFEGDTRKNSSLGEKVIGTQAADTVIDAVIKGKKTFTSTNTQVAGTAYFVAYVPVFDDSGNVAAMAFTGVSRESVNSQISRSVIIMVVISLVLLAVSVFVAIKISMGMAGAINAMNECIAHLAEGEFVKADKYLNRQDEIGQSLNNTNALVDKLSGIISHVKETSEKLNESSSELDSMSKKMSSTAESVCMAVDEVARGSTEQAESIQSATENVSNIDVAVTSVSDTAQALAEIAYKMNDSSKESEAALKKLESSFSQMSANIEDITSAVKATGTAVDTVNGKVELINGIASQTNLLALNASIEAARAGEQGRGFAVVATEIGTLATNSNNTANDIKSEMSNLLDVTGQATQKADIIQQIANDVTQVLAATIADIQGLIQDIAMTVENIDRISGNTEVCNSSKVVVVDAMSSLSAISEENAASTEETSASMTDLSDSVGVLAQSASSLKSLADMLEEDMSFFK